MGFPRKATLKIPGFCNLLDMLRQNVPGPRLESPPRMKWPNKGHPSVPSGSGAAIVAGSTVLLARDLGMIVWG